MPAIPWLVKRRALVDVHRRRDQPRPPQLAGDAANDEMRPRVLRRELEERQRRVGRRAACRSRRRRATAPSATTATAIAPATARRRTRRPPSARSRRAALRAPARAAYTAHLLRRRLHQIERARPAIARIGQRGAKRAQRLASVSSCGPPAGRSHTSIRDRPRRSKSISQRSSAHGEERRQRRRALPPHVPSDRRAGGEIQRAAARNEIAIEHQHAARSLQTKGPPRIGAIVALIRARAPPGRRNFFV